MSISGENLDFTMEFGRENVPAELRRRPQWVVYQLEERDGKETKVPYTPGTKRRADSTDSETWRPFEEAVRDDRGLGFVFTSGDPYTGIDLDKCRDPKTGAVELWARQIIEDLGGYVEASPSGTGLHIIVKGKLPMGNNRRGHIEAYSSERYFTITGTGSGGRIPKRQEALEEFYREHLQDRPQPTGAARSGEGPTDEQVLEKLLHEPTGKGRALFAGDVSGYESHSNADQAFMNKLYFYTQDEVQIDAIWRRSGLYREKWNRADYRRRTYMRAANTATEHYEWNRVKVTAVSNPPNPANRPNPTNPANRTNPVVKSAAKLLETKMEPTRWAVQDVLPEGVTLLAGKPKQGKSWMALGLCEAIAAGGVAFGTRRVEKGETLYLALEDNERRMQKRIKKVLDGRGCPAGMNYATDWPRLEEGGAEALEQWLSDTPGARLVVVDTLAKIRKPARGQNVYAEDYSALESLLPLAARYGVAIVVVHHLRKGEAVDPQDEISGSTGLAGGVDGYMILRRKAGARGPTLYVDGRDIEEPAEYALHWNHNTACWTIEGTAEEVHMSEERGAILLELNRSPEPMSPKEVADVMPGKSHGAVKYLLHQMYHDDQVKRVSGRYEPANRTTNHGTPHENAGNGASVSGVSGVSRERPVSWDLEAGESATVGDLRARRVLSEDEERRVRRLQRQGFSEDSARKEVLAADHPVGCECEVCL